MPHQVQNIVHFPQVNTEAHGSQTENLWGKEAGLRAQHGTLCMFSGSGNMGCTSREFSLSLPPQHWRLTWNHTTHSVMMMHKQGSSTWNISDTVAKSWTMAAVSHGTSQVTKQHRNHFTGYSKHMLRHVLSPWWQRCLHLFSQIVPFFKTWISVHILCVCVWVCVCVKAVCVCVCVCVFMSVRCAGEGGGEGDSGVCMHEREHECLLPIHQMGTVDTEISSTQHF